MSTQKRPAAKGQPKTDADPAKHSIDAGSAEGKGGPTASEVPAPDVYPQAPIEDVGTIRVRQRTHVDGSTFFRAIAYVKGIRVGEVNATSAESALAGGTELVRGYWTQDGSIAHGAAAGKSPKGGSDAP